MAKIDIRDYDGDVDKIVFADGKSVSFVSQSLMIDGENFCARIQKYEVAHLIKALQKAVELGWTK